MRIRRCSLEGNAVLAVVSFVLLVSGTAFAQKENMLYIFSGQDGAGLYAAVVFDKAGNLYGTTKVGGLYNNGAVFQLSFQASGNWTEKTLYSFKYDGKDGDWPIGSLIFGTKGSLYGTTEVGGVYGAGTVFEVSPQDGGGWSEKILYSFSNIGPDGGYPHAGLLIDSVGNLYGTTPNGGSGGCPDYGCGTVFELIPNKTGGWSEKTLHSFTNAGGDGANPSSNLIFDAHGNLYGTTFNGGVNQYGTAFELSPTKSGQWKETILHTFTGTGSDGGNPIPGLIFDPAAKSLRYGLAGWQREVRNRVRTVASGRRGLDRNGAPKFLECRLRRLGASVWPDHGFVRQSLWHYVLWKWPLWQRVPTLAVGWDLGRESARYRCWGTRRRTDFRRARKPLRRDGLGRRL